TRALLRAAEALEQGRLRRKLGDVVLGGERVEHQLLDLLPVARAQQLARAARTQGGGVQHRHGIALEVSRRGREQRLHAETPGAYAEKGRQHALAFTAGGLAIVPARVHGPAVGDAELEADVAAAQAEQRVRRAAAYHLQQQARCQ